MEALTVPSLMVIRIIADPKTFGVGKYINLGPATVLLLSKVMPFDGIILGDDEVAVRSKFPRVPFVAKDMPETLPPAVITRVPIAEATPGIS